MQIRKSLGAAVSVSLVAAVTVMGWSGSEQGMTAQAATKQKSEPTLRMATSADYKPYEYHDTTGGQDKIVGFDIDVAKEIAKELHFKFTITDMTFDGLVGELQAHRADFVIAGMTPTKARQKSVSFSEIYYRANNAIVTKKGSKLTTLASLKGKRISVQLGSTQEQQAKGIKGAQVVSLDAIPQVIQDVMTNRVDAAIIEDTVAKGYLANNPNLQIAKTKSGDPGSAIAFPKGSQWVAKFNKVLTHMKKDGQMKKLIIKWFG